MNDIIETLKGTDNESTSAPYWLIIDPTQLGLKWDDGDETIYAALDDENCKSIQNRIPSCITGPFFSRGDAEFHLKGRRYAFGDTAYVYCHSGHASQKYAKLCRELKVGTY